MYLITLLENLLNQVTAATMGYVVQPPRGLELLVNSLWDLYIFSCTNAHGIQAWTGTGCAA